MHQKALSLKVYLLLLFGSITLTITLLLIISFSQISSRVLHQERGSELMLTAESLAHLFALMLEERERDILLLSQRTELVDGPLKSPSTRAMLDLVKDTFPYYAWVGVADVKGQINSSSAGVLEGVSVLERPWFTEGRLGLYIGEVHKAVLLSEKFPQQETGPPIRFIDFAAPIKDPNGVLKGVVASHVHWRWVGDTLVDFIPDDKKNIGIEVLIFDFENRLIHPYSKIETTNYPHAELTADAYTMIEWHDGKHLTAMSRVKSNTNTDMGLKIVVRQSERLAFAEARRFTHLIAYASIVIFILSASLVYFAADQISSPIISIARYAQLIKPGESVPYLRVRTKMAEIFLLEKSLNDMTQKLFEKNTEIEKQNQLLDSRVQERTMALAVANKELEHLTRHDPLTEILNRRAFNDILQHEFQRMKRSGQLFSIALIDIDHFKSVNDTHGHDVGDAVLQHLTRVITWAIRSTDISARLGGEEFIVLFPDTDETGLAGAEKICDRVEKSFPPRIEKLTVSIGYATVSADDTSCEQVVKRADQAMYKAKRGGRNRVVQFVGNA